MRKSQSSLTATGIAIMRGVESERPADERICYDPYARRFVPAWLYTLMRFFIRSGYAEWRGPGVNGFLAARDRYIDDVLQNSLGEGLQQLVILGAGYDSRAYRFDLAGMKVFEVDHPATQEDKLAKLKAIFGKIPEHVTYVPVDFNTQTLENRLLESGYEPKRKTLFIWQGVSMYLTSEAVDSTLAFVVNHSGKGSAVVFDYIHQAVLDAQKHGEIKNMRRYRFMTGEGLTFGIPEGAVETFLKERGFRSMKDVDVDYLKATYFTGKNAGRAVAGGYGIAIGTTKNI
ncbi:MAG TPA: SAM-dependent methyltransferase [Anaerolineales bacterium]|nr:SAM-dependent methyltransferase [Anaerolineales bacterium]